MHPTKASLSWEVATFVIEAALEEARSLGVRMNIAVVDTGASLKGFVRMDGALLGSIDIAIKKARTASLFEMESGDMGILAQPGASLYHIEQSNGGLITFAGGVPIKSPEGEIIGAIGVSGSTVENDRAVAVAGATISVHLRI